MRQQLDSFNDFINTSLQEIVDENKLISITPQSQHVPGMQVEDDVEKIFEVGGCRGGMHADDWKNELLMNTCDAAQVEFGQIYLSKPVFIEADGETAVLFPKEARLRNLTYAAPLYVDIERRDKVPAAAPAILQTTYALLLGWPGCHCACLLRWLCWLLAHAGCTLGWQRGGGGHPLPQSVPGRCGCCCIVFRGAAAAIVHPACTERSAWCSSADPLLSAPFPLGTCRCPSCCAQTIATSAAEASATCAIWGSAHTTRAATL